MTPSKQLLNELDQLIENYYYSHRATPETVNEANSFIDLLTRTLQEDVFRGKKLLAEEEIEGYMWKLRTPLEKLGCTKILILPNAKVPVVQFEWTSLDNKQLTFKGDIVFYKELSVYNSDLIKAYCNWDPRVVMFHKINGICQNTMRLGELFVGFFGYYANFDFEREAVAIHKTKLCKRSYIMNGLNIQEPFTTGFFGLKYANCWKKRAKVVNLITETYELLSQGRIPVEIQAQGYETTVNLCVLEATLFNVFTITDVEDIPDNKLVDLFHIPNYKNMTKGQRKKARKHLENDKELIKAFAELQF